MCLWRQDPLAVERGGPESPGCNTTGRCLPLAPVDLPFELVGELPGPWGQDCADFAAQAAKHDWGGLGPERLVLVQLVPGGFIDALQNFMPPSEFARWIETLGPNPRIASKTFTAHDGKVTSVMLPLPSREAFLTMFGQQFVSASMTRREIAEGYVWPEDADLSNSHVLWQHYVGNRARRDLADTLGWDLGDFDNTELASEAADVDSSFVEAAKDEPLTALPNEAGLRAWLMLLRVWCAAVGCADAGAIPYALELGRFREQPFASATGDAWDAATSGLREVWAHPHRATVQQDGAARDHVWRPLESAMRDVWAKVAEGQ